MGDLDLWKLLKEDAVRQACGLCGRPRACVSVERVAEEVDPVFREHVQLGETIRTFAGPDDEKGGWEQQGDEPTLLLQEIIGCDIDLANAIAEVLGEEEWYDVKDGGEPFYDDSSNYVYAPDFTHEHFAVWRSFQNRIKYNRRYLDSEVQSCLEDLFTEFPEEWTARDDGPSQEYAPGSLEIYRARKASSLGDVRTIFRNPDEELAPPPVSSRTAGRLNAAGIGVFYGGLSSEVCVAEMKPSLGGYVVVGRFEVIETIRVLDLTAFDRHPPSGSLFRPGYNEERLRWRFLQSFHQEITQPIPPGSESIEYVPTQVIAEYLHAHLGFDGVIYRSAQVGVTDSDIEEPPATPPELRNLALFGADGLIEGLEGEHEEADPTGDRELERFLGGWENTTRDERNVRSTPVLKRYDSPPQVLRVRKIEYDTVPHYVSQLAPDSSPTLGDHDVDF